MRKFFCGLFAVCLFFISVVGVYAQDLDVSLRDGIKLVLANSRLIKVSDVDTKMALMDTLTARAAFLPQVDFYLKENYYSRQPASKFGAQRVPTSEKQFLTAGVDVYQTLFDFGKSIYQYKATYEMLDAAQINLQIVRRLIVLEFILAYFDLLQAQKMVLAAETEVESLASYANDVEHMYQQGVVVKSDLLTVKVKLADSKQRLISTRNVVETAGLKLHILLALPLSGKINVFDVNSFCRLFYHG